MIKIKIILKNLTMGIYEDYKGAVCVFCYVSEILYKAG